MINVEGVIKVLEVGSGVIEVLEIGSGYMYVSSGWLVGVCLLFRMTKMNVFGFCIKNI